MIIFHCKSSDNTLSNNNTIKIEKRKKIMKIYRVLRVIALCITIPSIIYTLHLPSENPLKDLQIKINKYNERELLLLKKLLESINNINDPKINPQDANSEYNRELQIIQNKEYHGDLEKYIKLLKEKLKTIRDIHIISKIQDILLNITKNTIVFIENFTENNTNDLKLLEDITNNLNNFNNNTSIFYESWIKINFIIKNLLKNNNSMELYDFIVNKNNLEKTLCNIIINSK